MSLYTIGIFTNDFLFDDCIEIKLNSESVVSACKTTVTKSHTHCLAAGATRIQSQSKSVLSVV